MIPKPKLPFPGYKWRWLSLQPTEGLLSPPVFLGVLRALGRNHGKAPSSEEVQQDLKTVENDTNTDVDLVRSSSGRNLIRNSGQYWIGTGCYKKQRGIIELTNFGKQVASGQINQDEFAAAIINSTALPNKITDQPSEVVKWNKAGLIIFPFKTILSVLSELQKKDGEAYMTPFELIKIIIPLAGAKSSACLMAEAIVEFRNKRIDLSGWPDCAPMSNDPRIARQFLLFLSEFGICKRVDGDNRYDEKYYCSTSSVTEIYSARKEQLDPNKPDLLVSELNKAEIPYLIERQRRTISILARTGQGPFRERILDAFGNRCIITGETYPHVLEAAHIRPVKFSGSDQVGNGLCMRVDVHRLFDSGRIRIEPSGNIQKVEMLNASPTYKRLPSRITIPDFVSSENIRWRIKYL